MTLLTGARVACPITTTLKAKYKGQGDLARLGDGEVAWSSPVRQSQCGRSLTSTRVTYPRNMTLKAKHKVKEIWHASEMARSLGVLLSEKTGEELGRRENGCAVSVLHGQSVIGSNCAFDIT